MAPPICFAGKVGSQVSPEVGPKVGFEGQGAVPSIARERAPI